MRPRARTVSDTRAPLAHRGGGCAAPTARHRPRKRIADRTTRLTATRSLIRLAVATGRPGGSSIRPVIRRRPATERHDTARVPRSSTPTAFPSEPVTARPGRACLSAT